MEWLGGIQGYLGNDQAEAPDLPHSEHHTDGGADAQVPEVQHHPHTATAATAANAGIDTTDITDTEISDTADMTDTDLTALGP